MVATNARYITEVALEIHQLLNKHKGPLKLRQVWYGDMDKVPEVPGAAVDPGVTTRQLAGVPDRTLNTFQIFIYVYHGLLQDVQTNRLETDQRAEAIEALLHKNLQMGDKVHFGHVVQSESGATRRASGLFMATRLTWEGQSKRSLSIEEA